LILGGDITGKSLIPIERVARGWKCGYNDRVQLLETQAELEELEAVVRANGQYPIIGEHDELAALADEQHREEVFERVIVASIERWVDLADERLRGTGVRCLVTPGNDDYWAIDAPLQRGECIEFAEGKRVRLTDEYEVIATGYSNQTPWDSPRELTEDQLGAELRRMYAEVEAPESLIAVIHVPPYGTLLDQAPKLNDQLEVQTLGGAIQMASVGSTAVRTFFEQTQPMLGLHGHVHESRARDYIGRTLCLNPGSEYTTGDLACAVVTLEGTKVTFQLTHG
jgi:Icc-related predicted phosphoesterase